MNLKLLSLRDITRIMITISHTEENYLKAILKIAEKEKKSASTNAISKQMSTTAASVTDMIKRLSEKNLINYKKYHGVSLTPQGNQVATSLIRKHRLWEVFLVDKLNFGWDEVHDIAEQLEHIQSDPLIEKLDAYLGHPKFDPHGDPIPNAEGKFTLRNQKTLSLFSIGMQGHLVGVRTHETPFLQYLNDIKLQLGSHIKVVKVNSFDHSMEIQIEKGEHALITNTVSQNLFLKEVQL